MRTLTAPQIALLQNRAGSFSFAVQLQFLSGAWTNTGAILASDVFEYSFDKDKLEIVLKDSTDLGVILSYYSSQLARIQLTETYTDGTTTVSEPSPQYFIYTFQRMPNSKIKFLATALHFQVSSLDPVRDVDLLIADLFSLRIMTAAYITGQEWFDYDWSPAGAATIALSCGDLPRILGKRYMVETFAREADILFRNRYNNPNLVVDYTPFTTQFLETIQHTAYNIPINGISWTDELSVLRTSTGATQPTHHLGFVPSTATQAIMDLIDNVLQSQFKFKQWPDLRLENGDFIRLTLPDASTVAGLINCTHRLTRSKTGALSWVQEVEAVQTPSALGAGRVSNRVAVAGAPQISPISQELDTEFFTTLLDREDQSVQTALDKLDRHQHYALQGQCDAFSPLDATTYFIGNFPIAPTTTTTDHRIHVPRGGTINRVYVLWSSRGGAGGTSESISCTLQKNGVTDSATINSVANLAIIKVFSNTTLNFPVATGDYINLRLVCPTWATNPTSVKLSFVAFVET